MLFVNSHPDTGHNLQDYLETKRIAFPRFYFVAPADLLDILSKGSNPQLILRHLSKCFDSVCDMEFRLNEKGEPSKGALAMFDPKGERVNFADECMCEGPVETWLNGVVDAMKAALFHEFTQVLFFFLFCWLHLQHDVSVLILPDRHTPHHVRCSSSKTGTNCPRCKADTPMQLAVTYFSNTQTGDGVLRTATACHPVCNSRAIRP